MFLWQNCVSSAHSITEKYERVVEIIATQACRDTSPIVFPNFYLEGVNQKQNHSHTKNKNIWFPYYPTKEIYIMILNGVYPLLQLQFPIATDKCAFCDDTETTDHFF